MLQMLGSPTSRHTPGPEQLLRTCCRCPLESPQRRSASSLAPWWRRRGSSRRGEEEMNRCCPPGACAALMLPSIASPNAAPAAAGAVAPAGTDALLAPLATPSRSCAERGGGGRTQILLCEWGCFFARARLERDTRKLAASTGLNARWWCEGPDQKLQVPTGAARNCCQAREDPAPYLPSAGRVSVGLQKKNGLAPATYVPDTHSSYKHKASCSVCKREVHRYGAAHARSAPTAPLLSMAGGAAPLCSWLVELQPGGASQPHPPHIHLGGVHGA